jgi:hypothetical protein
VWVILVSSFPDILRVNQAFIDVDSLHDGEDFSTTVSRDMFNGVWSHGRVVVVSWCRVVV